MLGAGALYAPAILFSSCKLNHIDSWDSDNTYSEEAEQVRRRGRAHKCEEATEYPPGLSHSRFRTSAKEAMDTTNAGFSSAIKEKVEALESRVR